MQHAVQPRLFCCQLVVDIDRNLVSWDRLLGLQPCKLQKCPRVQQHASARVGALQGHVQPLQGAQAGWRRGRWRRARRWRPRAWPRQRWSPRGRPRLNCRCSTRPAR